MMRNISLFMWACFLVWGNLGAQTLYLEKNVKTSCERLPNEKMPKVSYQIYHNGRILEQAGKKLMDFRGVNTPEIRVRLKSSNKVNARVKVRAQDIISYPEGLLTRIKPTQYLSFNAATPPASDIILRVKPGGDAPKSVELRINYGIVPGASLDASVAYCEGTLLFVERLEYFPKLETKVPLPQTSAGATDSVKAQLIDAQWWDRIKASTVVDTLSRYANQGLDAQNRALAKERARFFSLYHSVTSYGELEDLEELFKDKPAYANYLEKKRSEVTAQQNRSEQDRKRALQARTRRARTLKTKKDAWEAYRDFLSQCRSCTDREREEAKNQYSLAANAYRDELSFKEVLASRSIEKHQSYIQRCEKNPCPEQYLKKVVQSLEKLRNQAISVVRKGKKPTEANSYHIVVLAKYPFADAAQPLKIEGLADNIMRTWQRSEERGQFELSLADIPEGEYEIILTDKQDNEERISFVRLKSLEIRISRILNAEGDTALSLSIMGGEAPYDIYVSKEGGTDILLNEAATRLEYQLSMGLIYETLVNELQGAPSGKYQLKVIDNKGISVEKSVVLHFAEQVGNRIWLWGGLVVLALIGGGLYLYVNQKNKEKSKITPSPVTTATNGTTVASTTRIEGPGVNRIKIKNKAEEGLMSAEERDWAYFRDVIKGTQKHDYYEVDLSQLWEDTEVRFVYYHYSVVGQINRFIQEETNQQLASGSKVIPEIGGFLLGRKILRPADKRYLLAVEQFIPVTPERQDEYQIGFGAKAWDELDDAKQRHQEMELIGWFHTHPGHGLFLSRPDIAIHEGFFPKSYQVAMEIDTKSADLDMALFSRNSQALLNNRMGGEEKSALKMLKWTQIEKWARTLR